MVRSEEMPLDSLEFSQDPMLARLARVERLLATERQWCKGRLRDSEGRHCLVGAIEAADCWPEVARVILRAAREVSGRRYWRIESFNDDPRTTHADVLAALRRARQNIIASMAKECDRQPWHRQWQHALRRLSPRSEIENAAVAPTAGRDASAANEVAALRGSLRAHLLPVIREPNEVS
jgi:hypothetical protein